FGAFFSFLFNTPSISFLNFFFNPPSLVTSFAFAFLSVAFFAFGLTFLLSFFFSFPFFLPGLTCSFTSLLYEASFTSFSALADLLLSLVDFAFSLPFLLEVASELFLAFVPDFFGLLVADAGFSSNTVSTAFGAVALLV